MSPDRILAFVMEYEAATNAALQALDGSDRHRQLAACLKWAAMMEPLNALADAERNRVGELLMQRGNVPHNAWPKILAALEGFEAERQARGSDRGT